LVLAILASGCQWTGTNVAYTGGELAHHLSRSETRYIITDRSYLDVVESSIRSYGRDVEIILFTDIVSGKPAEQNGYHGHIRPRSLHDLLAHGDELTLRRRLRAISRHSPAAILSTSGTTGLPKMVQRSHHSLVVETNSIHENNLSKTYPIRRLYCTPIFHAFSFPEMVINSLRLGYPSFFMRRFGETFARKVRAFKITETMAAPAMLLRILGLVGENKMDRLDLQSLQAVLCAGSPLAPELRTSFLQLFEKQSIRIVQVWGMSEGGWFATFPYPEHDDTGSVGRPLAGYQVRVSELYQVELPDGRQAGELLVKGLERTTSYKGDPVATKECFGSGWLQTGDIGYLVDGRVYLVDRAKDIIKVNGWTVSPAELEGTLCQMPGIVDAGALSAGTGTEEHAAIFVVSKEPMTSTADVMEHLLDRVARFKIATCEIHFTDSIPRNPSGKILRKVLRQRLEDIKSQIHGT
jgi:acyl-coenzyme A synthetase/AMP-(fatty) acid ligase